MLTPSGPESCCMMPSPNPYSFSLWSLDSNLEKPKTSGHPQRTPVFGIRVDQFDFLEHVLRANVYFLALSLSHSLTLSLPPSLFLSPFSSSLPLSLRLPNTHARAHTRTKKNKYKTRHRRVSTGIMKKFPDSAVFLDNLQVDIMSIIISIILASYLCFTLCLPASLALPP